MTEVEDAAATANGTPDLDAIVGLVGALDRAGVEYCHWKSNEAIARSASGENDLDLLISRQHAARFTAVLHDRGFRAARPRPEQQLPGIVDYYGLDAPTGRTVHVHAHYRLVLGDDMTKNFRLPVEEAYLASSTRDGLFPLPSEAFEYVVFVLRMTVKHATLDAQVFRRGRLTRTEQRELAYLQERIDSTEVDRILRDHLPFLSAALFTDCEAAIGRFIGPVARARVGQRLLRSLSDLGRRSPILDLGLRVTRRARRRAAKKLALPRPRKRPDTGGLLIGIVGGDGSGKSTAVAMLAETLSRNFETRAMHLGKPPRSVPTSMVKYLLRLARSFGRFPTASLPAGTDFEETGFPGYGFLVKYTLTARDRYRAYVAARRAATAGAIVICDRYPLAEVTLMDGPRAAGLEPVAPGGLARHFVRMEAGYYSRILPPDLLIVMRVDPEIAVARRRDEENDEFVRQRVAEIWERQWGDAAAVVIDASRPLDDVLAEVRDAVWGLL